MMNVTIPHISWFNLHSSERVSLTTRHVSRAAENKKPQAFTWGFASKKQKTTDLFPLFLCPFCTTGGLFALNAV